MGKFRSKLKRRTKATTWARGQSSTSNPENKKHRMAARSRFFQPNLSLGNQSPTIQFLFLPTTHSDCFSLNFSAPKTSTTNGITPLTLESVSKHDARQMYTADGKSSNKSEPTVHDLALSMRSFDISDDGMDDGQSFAKTFQTFGSRYSSCTNMTFNK